MTVENIRTFLTVLAVVAGFGTSVGVQLSTTQGLEEAQKGLQRDVRTLLNKSIDMGHRMRTAEEVLDDLATLDASVVRVQHQTERLQELAARSSVGVELLGKVSERLGEHESRLSSVDSYLMQVWPRLRAVDNNQLLFQRSLRTLGESIDLEQPDRF